MQTSKRLTNVVLIFAFLIALFIPFKYSLAQFPEMDNYYYYQGKKIPLQVRSNELVVSFINGETDLKLELENFSGVNRVEKLSIEDANHNVYRIIFDNNETQNRELIDTLPGRDFTSVTYEREGDKQTYFFASGVNARPKEGVSERDVVSTVSQYGLCPPEDSLETIQGNFYTLTACDPAIQFTTSANRLFESGLFEFASPNFVSVTTYSHDDTVQYMPQFESTTTSTPWHLENIHALSAQGIYDANHVGAKPIVAVIDTGVQLDHPQLTGNLLPGYDATINPWGDTKGGALVCRDFLLNPYPNDRNGHGTSVAGVIASNSVGVAGNRVSILPIRAGYFTCDDINNQTFVIDSGSLARSINWASHNGATVINLSMKVLVDDLISATILDASLNHNILVVAAAGNDGKREVMFPASIFYALAVGGSKSDFSRDFSPVCNEDTGTLNCGSNFGTMLDLSAPYSAITTIAPVGRTITTNGTSVSAPQVAAVAALMWGVNPSLNYNQVKDILYRTAQKSNIYTYSQGWNKEVGYGVVNAEKAVITAANTSQQPTVSFRALLDRAGNDKNSKETAIAVFDDILFDDGTYHLRFSTKVLTNSAGYSEQVSIPNTPEGDYLLCVKPFHYTFKCTSVHLASGQNSYVDFSSDGSVFYGGDLYGGSNSGDGEDGVINALDLEIFRPLFISCGHSSSVECLVIDWSPDGQINGIDWVVENINYSSYYRSDPSGKEWAYFNEWHPFRTNSTSGVTNSGIETSNEESAGTATVILYNYQGAPPAGSNYGVNVYVDISQVSIGAGSLNLVIHYDPGVWDVIDFDPTHDGIQIETLPGVFSSSLPGIANPEKGEIVFGALMSIDSTTGTTGKGLLAVLPLVAKNGIANTEISAELVEGDSTLSNIAEFNIGTNIIGDITNFQTAIDGGISRQMPEIEINLPNGMYINSNLAPITITANDEPYNQVQKVDLYAYFDGAYSLVNSDTVAEDGWNFMFDSSYITDQLINLCAEAYIPGGEYSIACIYDVVLDRTEPEYIILENANSTYGPNSPVISSVEAIDNFSYVKQIELYVNTATDGSTSGTWEYKGNVSGETGTIDWQTDGLLEGSHRMGLAIEDYAGNWDRLSSLQANILILIQSSTEGVCSPARSISLGESHSYRNDGTGSTDQIDLYPMTGWDESGPEYTYSFVSTVSGTVTVTLSDWTADLDIFILDGLSGSCNAENTIEAGDYEVNFEAIYGQTYYFVIDGFEGAVGDYTITVTGSSGSNDSIFSPEIISTIPSEFNLDTSGTTHETGDPSFSACGQATGLASVWYLYEAIEDGEMTLDTMGSDYNTMVGVWRGSPGALTLVGCNDNALGKVQSQFNFKFTTGTDYYIGVAQKGTTETGGALKLHATTFQDVNGTHPLWRYVEGFFAKGITTGCAVNPLRYCPDQVVTRGQMAVFLLRAIHVDDPVTYVPEDVEPDTFADPPVAAFMEPWIEQFYATGITTGCAAGPLRYCPERNVTRGEMAVFILRAVHGSSYTPPPATGVFIDVPASNWMRPWIEELYHAGITTGCGGSAGVDLMYCPGRAVNRAEMATFVDRAFGFPQMP